MPPSNAAPGSEEAAVPGCDIVAMDSLLGSQRDMLVRNVGIHLPSDEASHSRRREPFYRPLLQEDAVTRNYASSHPTILPTSKPETLLFGHLTVTYQLKQSVGRLFTQAIKFRHRSTPPPDPTSHCINTVTLQNTQYTAFLYRHAEHGSRIAHRACCCRDIP